MLNYIKVRWTYTVGTVPYFFRFIQVVGSFEQYLKIQLKCTTDLSTQSTSGQQKIVVSHTKHGFKAALVSMCVEHAISFSFFSSASFKALCGEVAAKLQEKSLDFLNSFFF